MEGLDPGPRLIAAGRAAADRFAAAPLAPVPLVDAVIAWVAVKSAAFLSWGARGSRAPLRVRARDALMLVVTLTPALALLGG